MKNRVLSCAVIAISVLGIGHGKAESRELLVSDTNVVLRIGEGNDPLLVARGQGLTVGPDGAVYVSEVSGTPSVFRCDRDTGECSPFVSVLASPEPRGLAFGPNGNLYVLDTLQAVVDEYDGLTGDYIRAAVAPGNGGIDTPTDMAFGPDGSLYVASGGSGEVVRFDVSEVGAVVLGRISHAELTEPYGLAFDAEGLLYVSGRLSDNIARFSAGGDFIDFLVTQSSNEIREPKDIIADAEALYVINRSSGWGVDRFSLDDGSPLGRVTSAQFPRFVALTPDVAIDPEVIVRITDSSLSIAGGELLEVTVRFLNGPEERSTKLFAWLALPNESIRSVLPASLQGDFVFGTNQDSTSIARLGPAGTNPLRNEGEYILGVRVVDSTTGALLSQSVRRFDVVP